MRTFGTFPDTGTRAPQGHHHGEDVTVTARSWEGAVLFHAEHVRTRREAARIAAEWFARPEVGAVHLDPKEARR